MAKLKEAEALVSIPADVRSAVYERDGGQCTFVSEDGHRCQETRYLQVDHVEMYCRGGEPTVANTPAGGGKVPGERPDRRPRHRCPVRRGATGGPRVSA